MIGKFFRWCFNLLRTFSFFLVLSFVLLLTISHFYPQWRLEAWTDSVLAEEVVMQSNVSSGPNTPEPSRQVEPEVRVKEKVPDLKVIKEKVYPYPKLNFLTPDIDFSLRASEIVLVKSSSKGALAETKTPYCRLTTIDTEEYQLHERQYNLKDIWSMLPDTTHFFKIKKAIINFDYIEEMIRPQRKVNMENGQSLIIPRDAFRELQQKRRASIHSNTK